VTVVIVIAVIAAAVAVYAGWVVLNLIYACAELFIALCRISFGGSS
jgi:hypothetical protein